MQRKLKIFILLFTAGILFSCSEEDKDPIPFTFNDGGWVKFQEAPNFALDVSDLNDALFASTIIDPVGNISSYQIDVIANVGGTIRDTVPFRTITSFPATFNVTPQDLATALGINVNQLSGGDSFKFLGTVTTTDGRVYDYRTPAYSNAAGFNGGLTHPTLLSAPGFRNALNFTINFVCPFNAAASAGTYRIVRDDFDTSAGDDIFEVVAGPGENQVTMVNPFDHTNPATGQQDYRVIINVNPNTGIANVATQQAWHCVNFGCGFGVASVTSSGSSNFVFSCSGSISLFLQHTVAAGSFGSYRFIAEKMD